MCNTCYNDCSCNKSTQVDANKTTPRFEVGKKYKNDNNSIAECLWSGERAAVLKHDNEEYLWGHSLVNKTWTEYIEPPKVYFKDLKPGEKFKWKDNYANAVCQKVAPIVGHINWGFRKADQAWIVVSEGIILANRETQEEVIRVKD